MTTTARLKINGRSDQFIAPLRDLAPFNTGGSLKGRPGRADDVGRLPSMFWASVTAPTVDYVVTSYETPIAWHDSDTGWHVPDERYSVTTLKQQGRIRAALDNLEDGE